MPRKRPAPERSRSRTVKASDAAKNFGALVERVREEHATYVVERAGVPVVQIAPVDRRRATVADLADILRHAGRLDESCLREIERGVAYFNQPAVPSDPWES